MAITQGFTTSFMNDLMRGLHDFTTTGDTFKIALYTSSATLDSTTTDYTSTNEITGTGYTAGGATLTVAANPATSGTTIICDFQDVSWPGATFTARGALIYNTTTGGGSGTTDSVAVLDFGTDKTVTAGTFTVNFPSADALSAIIRLTTS